MEQRLAFREIFAKAGRELVERYCIHQGVGLTDLGAIPLEHVAEGIRFHFDQEVDLERLRAAVEGILASPPM